MLEEKLKSGQYHSADEVVHATLQALEELESHHLRTEVQGAIDRAKDRIECGQFMSGMV
jgi:putative addiction module CopG family antidote